MATNCANKLREQTGASALQQVIHHWNPEARERFETKVEFRQPWSYKKPAAESWQQRKGRNPGKCKAYADALGKRHGVLILGH